MGAILCDGCGQPATPEHIAERIHRLELATRYRPIHIQVLWLILFLTHGVCTSRAISSHQNPHKHR
jgi:hypothetical protein